MQNEDSFIESNRNGRAKYGKKGVCSIGSQRTGTAWAVIGQPRQWLISSAFIAFVINASGPINSERELLSEKGPKWLPKSVRDTANGSISQLRLTQSAAGTVALCKHCVQHRQHLIMTA